MMKSKLSKILFVLMSFSFVVNVKALSSFPATFATQAEGTGITLNNNHSLQIDTSHSVSDTHYYPYFHIKNSSAGNIICVSGLGANEPVANLTCSKVSWDSDNQDKGVAYIINTIIGEGGKSSVSNEKYYWTEVLINDYLGTYTPGSSSYMNVNVINTGIKIAGTGKTYNEILNGAASYASDNYDVNLTASKTSLSFTLDSDGYYYSDPITINSTTTPKLSLSNGKFSYDVNGSTYTFKIKSSDVAIGSSESLSVSVTNSGKSYYTAQRYDCGSNYQDVTLSQTVLQTVEGKSIKITGTVSKPATEIKIGKVNGNGSFLSGATLKFQTASEYQSGSAGTIITTNSEYYTISGLSSGTYYLTEVTSPAGYVKITDMIIIKIDDNGTVTVDNDNVAVSGTEIKLLNELTKTEISKISVSDGKELSGATLQILDKDSKQFSCNILDEEGNEKTLNNCSWVSGINSVTVVGLPQGTYYLVETLAPAGYILNTEKIMFEVKSDGSTKKVEMKNELTRVVINKINSVDKNYLPGATLEIQDETGNIVKYCKDQAGNSVECKWISSDSAYEIVGMPKGTYYLVETLAPEGYHLNTEKVEFIVDGETPIIEVEMINQLEVEVPNTLSSRSALLLAIAMFDIALGIGIITYVKKNKIKEQ